MKRIYRLLGLTLALNKLDAWRHGDVTGTRSPWLKNSFCCRILRPGVVQSEAFPSEFFFLSWWEKFTHARLTKRRRRRSRCRSKRHRLRQFASNNGANLSEITCLLLSTENVATCCCLLCDSWPSLISFCHRIFLSLSFYLSLSHFIYLSLSLCICLYSLSILNSPSMYFFLSLCVYLSLSVYFFLSLCVSAYLTLSAPLSASVSLTVSFSVYLSVCVHASVFLFSLFISFCANLLLCQSFSVLVCFKFVFFVFNQHIVSISRWFCLCQSFGSRTEI